MKNLGMAGLHWAERVASLSHRQPKFVSVIANAYYSQA